MWTDPLGHTDFGSNTLAPAIGIGPFWWSSLPNLENSEYGTTSRRAVEAISRRSRAGSQVAMASLTASTMLVDCAQVFAGDVERGAVIDRRADEWDSEVYRYRLFETVNLNRYVALVVIHDNDDVVHTVDGLVENRVRGVWSSRVNAL